MSKRELIDAIIRHNRTAAPEFLAKFQERELKKYLDRVCATREKTISADVSDKQLELMAV